MRDIKINGQGMKGQVEFLAHTVLSEIKNPSKTKQRLVFVGNIIGVIASYVYYRPTQQLIKEKNYSEDYSWLFLAGSLGVNPLLNAFFNASAVNTVFNLRDPVTEELKFSKGVLAATGVLSLASAFIMAFLTPPDETALSYGNFFIQLICHAAQSYVGTMMAVIFFRGLFSDTTTVSPAKQVKSQLSKAIDSLLSEYSLDADFDMSQFKKNGEISSQKLSEAIMGKCQPYQPEPDSKTPCTFGFILYLTAQGLGFNEQIISLIGYQSSGINGFNNMIGILWLAWALATFAIMPIVSVSLQISYDSTKTLASIDLRNPFKNMPYEIRKTSLPSTFCLLIMGALAICSFPTTLDLLQDAIYNTSPEDNPAQFAWMDSGNDIFNCIFMILGCFGTVFFNAFPLIDVQASLSGYYLSWGETQEAKSFREKSQLNKALAAIKARVEEIPEHVKGIPTFVVGLADVEAGPSIPITTHRVTSCNQFMAWLRFSSPCCADDRTGYALIN